MLIEATKLVMTSRAVTQNHITIHLYENALGSKGYYYKNDMWFNSVGKFVASSAKEACELENLQVNVLIPERIWLIDVELGKWLVSKDETTIWVTDKLAWLQTSRSIKLLDVVDKHDSLVAEKRGY